MVELKLNIKKRQVWLLVLLVVAVGFVIAQSPGVSHLPAEITGFDARVNSLIDTKINTAMGGKSFVEGRLYSLGTRQPWVDANLGTTSLAQWTNVYTGNRCCGQFHNYKGCTNAMTGYCQTQGYTIAAPVHTTCGAGSNNDDPCPDTNGCTLSFYCMK